MNLDELEKVTKASEADVEFEADDEADAVVEDLKTCFGLLKQCMHLMDYVSDVELCKTVSKRERDSMERLSTKVCSFLDATEGQYEDL